MKLFNLINFLINNPCEDPNVLKVILFIRKILEIAFIIVPIVLIVLITFDFIKSVMTNSEDNMKKNQKIVIKRLVYAVMLFFVIPIVNLVFSAFGTSGYQNMISEEFDEKKVSYLSCWDNAKDKDRIAAFEIIATFNENGGKIYGDKQKTCGGSNSCEVTAPSVSRKGYTFYGWASDKVDEDFSNLVKIGDKITITRDNNIFYACWDENCTKDYIVDNGEEDSTGGINSDFDNTIKFPDVNYSDKKQIVTVYNDNYVYVYRCSGDYYLQNSLVSDKAKNPYSCIIKMNETNSIIKLVTKMTIPIYKQFNYDEQSACGGGPLSSKGCLPTSGAMIFGALQNDLTLKPNDMNEEAKTLFKEYPSTCFGSSYSLDFLINYSEKKGAISETFGINDVSNLRQKLKTKNTMGIAALKDKGWCQGDVKKACYDDVYHFVVFFVSDDIDNNMVNILDPASNNYEIFKVDIKDLINSTQAKAVRIFYME